MVIDDEILGELDEFLDDTLLMEFASDQGHKAEWWIERVASGYRCTISLNGAAMPPVIANNDQTALDNASVQVIELLTSVDPAQEPELALT